MKRFSIPPREERERHSHTMSAYNYPIALHQGIKAFSLII